MPSAAPLRLIPLLLAAAAVGALGGCGRPERLAGVDAGTTGLEARVIDLSAGPAGVRSVYQDGGAGEALFRPWLDPQAQGWAGDFTRVGHDQLLLFNPDPDRAEGRLLVADVSSVADGSSPRLPYQEGWGENATLDGWQDPGDLQLVGDFLGFGFDQLLLVNRDPREQGGRVMIVDLAVGDPPRVLLREAWGEHTLLDGWHDADDLQLAGDFMGLGHDQVLLVNRDPRQSGGRVMVADFLDGPPVQALYLEPWGRSALLDGWHDENDLQLAGDFMGLGRDQLLLINRDPQRRGSRLMIVDLRGVPPARRLHVEGWGGLPDGWDDPGDLQLVGDFLALGHDQLLLVDRDAGRGGRMLVVEFRSGTPLRTARFGDAASSAAAALLLGGDFAGLGHDQLLRIGPAGPPPAPQ